MTIKVFSKPACVQCTATYRALDKYGLEYEVVDLSTDDAALAHITSLGFQQAPVVIDDADAWSGFRPDKIKATAARLSAA